MNSADIFTVLCFIIGFFSCFFPILPGCFIVWLGLLAHKIWVPDASISWSFFWFATFLTLLAQLLDILLTYWGARRFGATWRGGLGAIIGVFVFPFLLTPFVGLLIGPVLGAFIGELTGGRSMKAAGKAGLGTIVGNIMAFAIKLGIALFMISGFIWSMYINRGF
jgi:hypothetical protein